MSSSSMLLLLLPLLLLGSSAHAQSAPGAVNITRVLLDGELFTDFFRLVNRTWTIDQLEDLLNTSLAGVTVLAPTNNAFLNLPPGALDNLSPQQRVELAQNHICPKYYSLTDLRSVRSLNTTAKHNQVNVPTGAIEAPVYKDFPLAVYRLDKVLMPRFDVGAGDGNAPAPAPAPAENGRVAGAAAGRIGLVAAFWVMCMGLVL